MYEKVEVEKFRKKKVLEIKYQKLERRSRKKVERRYK